MLMPNNFPSELHNYNTSNQQCVNEYAIVEIQKLFSSEFQYITLEYINDYLPEHNKNNLVSYLSLTENEH